MRVILSYDISSSKQQKLHKECKKYLIQIHESVFEGNISIKKINRLKDFIGRNINCEMDSVVIYYACGPDSFARESIGRAVQSDMLFI